MQHVTKKQALFKNQEFINVNMLCFCIFVFILLKRIVHTTSKLQQSAVQPLVLSRLKNGKMEVSITQSLYKGRLK